MFGALASIGLSKLGQFGIPLIKKIGSSLITGVAKPVLNNLMSTATQKAA